MRSPREHSPKTAPKPPLTHPTRSCTSKPSRGPGRSSHPIRRPASHRPPRSPRRSAFGGRWARSRWGSARSSGWPQRTRLSLHPFPHLMEPMPQIGLSALGPVCILPLTSWNPCHAGFLLPVFVADLHSKAFRIFQSKSRREASVLTDPCLKMGSQGGHLKHWHGLPWAHPVKS